MKNGIMKKLRSDTGASITFGLLLFLVCAVVSSVVLAAATAAAGRMSRTPENDQRYYSVTSAAGLLKNMIDGETVSVVEVTEQSVTYRYTGSGRTVTDEGESVTTVCLVRGKSAAEIEAMSVDDMDEAEAAAQDSILHYAAYTGYTDGGADAGADEGGDSAAAEVHYALTAEDGGAIDALTVSVKETQDAEGNLTFEISDDTEERDGQYTLRLTFKADRQESSGESAAEGPRTNISASDGSYEAVTTTTKKKVITYTWHLSGMETV